MVRIAIAGGSGQVAQEIIDELVLTKKHDIIILSRNLTLAPKELVAEESRHGVTWHTVDFDDKNELANALRGVHNVLSFIQLLNDTDNKSQKNLIDAAVIAGVKRLAPSEWGSSGIDNMPWWTGKKAIREYLEKLNENEPVLEYSLFQPGLFLDYLAYPHQTSRHVTPLSTMFDFENRRAISIEGCDPVITLTTVRDLAKFVAQAVEYEGTWPVNGGIQGNKVSFSKILEIGKGVCGTPFSVDQVKLEDLEAGILTTSWGLRARHPSLAEDKAADMLKSVLIGMLLSSAKGAWTVSDDFNRCLPDFKFTNIGDFLANVWGS
ncbi:hypothetical protein PFICI_11000 [Pestalotiopsis fici W106-1]|uniref:NmrA-like domain-containing protein n=1 Tax=Pestalotiopsis fici (strain W106-1 / CGMCC3.15140) TaxID=1229662 RepID=W3WW93_PESFW|nr:uncharacterized protein PFICI_11000 [Pestalotiopsis fici W106-1]ETS77126.1 hypothetical protein PFICI_11000 [Pestalotiopsis fici W106-1]